MKQIAEFYHLSHDAKDVVDRMSNPLPLEHWARANFMNAKTYGDVAKEFLLGATERRENWHPTFPFGPPGVSTDGVLVAPLYMADRGTMVLRVSHMDYNLLAADDYALDSDHLEMNSHRLILRSRDLGEFTLLHTLKNTDQAFGGKLFEGNNLGLVDITRTVDLSLHEYSSTYNVQELAVQPIGSLTGGTSAAVPIFSIADCLDRA